MSLGSSIIVFKYTKGPQVICMPTRAQVQGRSTSSSLNLPHAETVLDSSLLYEITREPTTPLSDSPVCEVTGTLVLGVTQPYTLDGASRFRDHLSSGHHETLHARWRQSPSGAY